MLQPASRQLFGRHHELAVLIAALADSEGGRARIVWLGGEPGIGKTRLAEELAAAASPGATVLWARCADDDTAPPYWPWAEVARGVARTHPVERLHLPAASLDRLSALVPDVLPPATTSARSSLNDRYQLFDAVRTLLRHAADRTTLVLVLDDLHHADAGSLLLLEFITRELADARLLIVCTHRTDETSLRLRETIGEIARIGLQQLVLTGLAPHETAQLLTDVSGRACSEAFARDVHARSGGNPFFVTEIAHLRDPEVIPDNVRAVLHRRLGRLSPSTIQLLTVGAVLGRDFDFRLTVAIISTSAADLLSALDEALVSLLVEPLPGAGENWYRFRHSLVCDAVYESVSPSRRAHWHAAVVELLEQRLGPRVDEKAVDLAYHAVRAEGLVGSSRVAAYSRIAGDQMLAAHAFEDARRHFQRAWRVKSAEAFDDEAAGILAGLGHAEAATTVRWNRQAAWTSVQRAVEHYAEAGEIGKAVAAVTHASLAAEGVSGVADVIQRLMPAVPEGSREKALLMARGAAAMYFETGSERPAQHWFARAGSIAVSQQDAALELRVLAQAMSFDHFALRWDDALAKTGRLLDLAARVDELHAKAFASYRAAFVLVHAGRTDEAQGQAQENLAIAERLGDRGLVADALYVKVLIAQLAGDAAEARVHSDRGLALAAGHLPLLHARAVLEYETGHDAAGGSFVHRLMQADRDARPYPLAGVFTAMALAQIAHLTNDTSDAGAAMRAARAVMARAPSVRNAVVSAQMAHALLIVLDEDVDACENDLEALAPFASVMPTQWGLATGRLLGLLAHAAGQKRRAWQYFDQALAFCRTSRFMPELAWTCHDYAVALVDLGDRDDRARAATLLDEAEPLATRLGLEPLRRRTAALRERYRLRLAPHPAGLTARELDVLQLLACGKANREIAVALGISTHTVAVHVARVLEKTGAANRTAAAAYAIRQHLIEPLAP